MASSKKISVYWYGQNMPEAKKISRIIQIPGKHNILNALGAYTLAVKCLGISPETTLAAIKGYRGSWRRMEYRGKLRIANRKSENVRHKPLAISQSPIYDDYAHHPTEIKATLAGFREAFPKSKIICVFQPHQALRLQKLFSEFKSSFTDTDMLILLPTYEVAGRDWTRSPFTSERLAKEIQKKYPQKRAIYLQDTKKIKAKIFELLSPTSHLPNPIIVMMGAGDIVNYTRLLL